VALFRILFVGYECTLLDLRSQVLRQAGYGVEEARSRQAALELAESDSVDLMVICDSLPSTDQQWLISQVHRKRRMLPVVCIGNYAYVSTADGCVGIENTPDALLDAVKLAAEQRRGPQPPP